MPTKQRIGRVVSDRRDKTITVQVENLAQHPLYRKRVRRRKTFHAHDEHEQARAGDFVRIAETRPLSKTKRWRLVEVVQRASEG